MDTEDRIERIKEILIPLCHEYGLDLWGVSLASGARHKNVLRVFIDAENGVDIEQCSKISRELGVILDVEDVMPGSYTLEVSSPGLERYFFSITQLEKYLGQTVKVELLASVAGRKNYMGSLKSVGQSDFILEIDGQDFRIQWDTIRKARLVYSFDARNE